MEYYIATWNSVFENDIMKWADEDTVMFFKFF
jgi:hypothetical protein